MNSDGNQTVYDDSSFYSSSAIERHPILWNIKNQASDEIFGKLVTFFRFTLLNSVRKEHLILLKIQKINLEQIAAKYSFNTFFLIRLLARDKNIYILQRPSLSVWKDWL